MSHILSLSPEREENSLGWPQGKKGYLTTITQIMIISQDSSTAAAMSSLQVIASSRRNTLVRSNILSPGENDYIFCCRGNSTHIGNIKFIELVAAHKLRYLSPSQGIVAKEIVNQWRAMDPPGRFLDKSDDESYWYDVGDKEAKEKTLQSLQQNHDAAGSVGPLSGKWSELEKAAFELGCERFGWGAWKSIADQLIPTRSRIQVKSYAQKLRTARQNIAKEKKLKMSAVERNLFKTKDEKRAKAAASDYHETINECVLEVQHGHDPMNYAVESNCSSIFPSAYDVCCGSSPHDYCRSVGNRRFRLMVEMSLYRCERLLQGELWDKIVTDIFRSFTSCNPPVRFLAIDFATGKWRLLNDVSKFELHSFIQHMRPYFHSLISFLSFTQRPK